MVPKEIQAHIKEHVILSVALKEKMSKKDYVGTGVIKKVRLVPKKDFLLVTLQIDVMFPLNKKSRQKTPQRGIEYEEFLDMRVRYDSSNVFSQLI